MMKRNENKQMTDEPINRFLPTYDRASKKYGIIGIDAQDKPFTIYVNDEATQQTVLKELIDDYENTKVKEEFIDGTVILDISVYSDEDYGFEGMIDSRYSKTLIMPESDVHKGVALLDNIKNTLFGRVYCCVRVAYAIDYIKRSLIGIQNNEFDYAGVNFGGNDEVEISVCRNKPKEENFKPAPELYRGEDYEAFTKAYELEHPGNFIERPKQKTEI